MKKLFSKLRANQRGFSHHFVLPALVVIAIIGVGIYLLKASHAEELPSASNSAAAATPNIAFSYKSLITNKNPNPPVYDKTVNPATKTVQTLAGGSTTNWITSPIYSPNHKYLAWLQFNHSANKEMAKILNTQTNVTSSFAFPVGQTEYGVQLQWYPDSSKIVMPLSTYRSATQSYDYYLDIMSVTNGKVTAVPKLNNGDQINSFTVAGDNQSIVFVNTHGSVYSIVPGSSAVLVHDGGSGNNYCGIVRRINGTNQVAFECEVGGKTQGFENIYTATLGSTTATTVYQFTENYLANGTWNGVTDLQPSPDGSKIAVLYDKHVVSDATNCVSTVQTNVATLSVAANSSLATVYAGPTSAPGGGCYGGGGPVGNSIQWSPDASKLAFLLGVANNQPAGTSLELVSTTPGASGTPAKLVGPGVTNISW